MKKLVQIVLGVGIIFLAYIVYQQVMTPLKFQETRDAREKVIIEQLKDIRTAERAFKQVYSRYTGDFDSLIHFILHDSLVFKKSMGSADDSLAVAQGRVKTEEFKVLAADTIFSPKKLTVEQIKNLPNMPFSDGKKFILRATNFRTESEVVVPVFECKAPYKDFLYDLNEQEIVNLIDERQKVEHKYAGLQVGSIEQATNDAGNWE